ncbi:hypothetical protein NDU88_004144 [Pleurodeles waltl]|uniref:Uncharacterized protein n=1 Tax=Pleurodeles waltl TaxID=8319 RepID=A0AAV7VIF5_PLEWA|nr:hypothetical protein NDU88_004144 [Pleurodeles waltl]
MVPQCGDDLGKGHDDGPHCGTNVPQFLPEPHVPFLLQFLDLLEPGQYCRHRLLGAVRSPMGRAGHLAPGRQSCCHRWGPLLGVGWTSLDPPWRCGGVRVLQGYKARRCGPPICLKDRRMDLWVGMVWAYFCWRDGGGLVIAIFSLSFGVADFCGCRVFGGLPVAGQNVRGGLPRPRRCYGGLLTGGKRLLPPWSE